MPIYPSSTVMGCRQIKGCMAYPAEIQVLKTTFTDKTGRKINQTNRESTVQ